MSSLLLLIIFGKSLISPSGAVHIRPEGVVAIRVIRRIADVLEGLPDPSFSDLAAVLAKTTGEDERSTAKMGYRRITEAAAKTKKAAAASPKRASEPFLMDSAVPRHQRKRIAYERACVASLVSSFMVRHCLVRYVQEGI